MGYNSTASTLTLTAKLTPLGRQMFAMNPNNSIISTFSLGDSDANYNASNLLTTGQIPAEAGEVGPNSTTSNSTTTNANIKSFLIANGSGDLFKPVESLQSAISVQAISNGQITISGSDIRQTIIDRTDYETDSLVNLFYSFGLSLDSTSDNIFTGITYANGGYSDTALSGLAQTKILVISIDNSTYGEIIDGKEIKLNLPTSAGTFIIYSTFQNKGANLKTEDANLSDTSSIATSIDQNIALLFSDTIQKPNNDSSLSWATGFGTLKPFSLNGKQLYNFQSDSNTATIADKVIGVAYLDKGFLVITEPTIVNGFTGSTATTITLDSVSTEIYQNITCIADRGEFGSSTNTTFGSSDTPRVSEVGLYDNLGNLIAIAKTDRHVPKNINDFVAFGVKINL